MHDKIVFLAKSKLNEIEVLISKALLDSNISLVEFVLISNVLKEYQEMKEEIKNLKTQSKFIYKTMLSYCLRVEKIHGRIFLLSKCAACDSKKSKFIKQQETSGLLRTLGIKTPLSKIPLVSLLLF